MSNKSPKELENFTIDTVKEICKIVTTCDESLVFDFFKCIFTPAELKDLANRWLLVKEIDKGVTQREIAEKYNMSVTEIMGFIDGISEAVIAGGQYDKMMKKMGKGGGKGFFGKRKFRLPKMDPSMLDGKGGFPKI